MKKLLCTTAAFLLVISGASAQHNPWAILGEQSEISSSLQLSHERFPTRIVPRSGQFSGSDSMRFQSVIQKVLDDSSDIGIAAGINDAMGALWSDAVNSKNLSPSAQMDGKFVLGIGSNTKSITATAILLLMEDGKLTLEDSLGQWLPPYPNIDNGITIRQCLQMTSGIFNLTDHPNFLFTILQAPTKIWTPDELLKTFVSDPLFPKGTSWAYSNTNYLLLGLIIEKASGIPYAQFVRQRIIEPLQLSSMSYYPLEAPTAPMAHAWVDVNGDGQSDDLNSQNISLKAFFSAAGAAGAYLATAQDLARWNQALFGGKILKPSSLEEMKKEYPLGAQAGYGLGIIALHSPIGDLYGHNGSIIYQSLVYYQPELEVSISAIVNSQEDVNSLNEVFNQLLRNYISILTNNKETPHPKLVIPSPFDTQLFIPAYSQLPYHVKVVDISSGAIRWESSTPVQGPLYHSTADWREGLYLLQIQMDNGMHYRQKIVKVKR